MPEELWPEVEQEVDEEQSSSRLASSRKREGKGRRRWSFFFIAFFVVIGIITGLYLTGVWDLRPTLSSFLYKLPVVGHPLAERLGLTSSLPLSADERRRMELEEWTERLNEQEAAMNETQAHIDMLMTELVEKEKKLAVKEAAFVASQKQEIKKEPETVEVFQSLVQTFREMSPRKAASILEELKRDLAVEILLHMPEDGVAAILARMDPARAARLTEQLALEKDR